MELIHTIGGRFVLSLFSKPACPLLLLPVILLALAGILAAGPAGTRRDTQSAVYLPLLVDRDRFMELPLTIRPQRLAPDTILANSGAGWYSQVSPPPVPLPMGGAYRRFVWRDLEPAEGTYDFSKIDDLIERARESDRQVGLRVRAMLAGDSGGYYVPDYLLPYGWWHGTTFVPDWNHPYFLERSHALLQALGERYDGELYFVDIGMLYKYGEWSASGIDYNLAPSHIQMATEASKRRLVDSHVEAFQTTRLIMFALRRNTIRYVLETYPRVGLRNDSTGTDVAEDHMKGRHDAETQRLIAERWKTAPVITEFIDNARVIDPVSYQKAVEQAHRYHISMIGDNNIHAWHDLSPEAQVHVHALARIGFRFRLDELVMPARVPAGGAFEVKSQWSNDGTTPAYQPWAAVIQLRDAGNDSTQWEGQLGVDFERLLPAETVVASDQFDLPADLPAGDYDLILAVRHPGRAPNMALAIEGMQEDGRRRWYELGTLRVTD